MKRAAVATLGVGGVLLLAALGAFLWARSTLLSPFKESTGEVVLIQSGTSAREILDQLEREGVLAHATLTRLYLARVLGDPPLKAGEYRFDEPLSALEVLDVLVRGAVITHALTLPEGLTLEETAELIHREGFGDEQALLGAMRDPALIAEIDPEASTLEGYLFPETYHFARSTAESEIVAALVQTFLSRLEEVRTVIPDDGMNARELVTLASIVEKEARLDSERPLIASVFRNRLDRGIALYADPTIIYALKLAGTWDGDLRRRDLELDSPYNTYRYSGLPPGPICSPGAASLTAAHSPASTSLLYFVSRNDGSHVFSETLAEHNRNVNRWQREYWRQRSGQ